MSFKRRPGKLALQPGLTVKARRGGTRSAEPRRGRRDFPRSAQATQKYHFRKGRDCDPDRQPSGGAERVESRGVGGNGARDSRGPPRLVGARANRHGRGRSGVRRRRGYRGDVENVGGRRTRFFAPGPSRDGKFRGPADPRHRGGQRLRARRRSGACACGDLDHRERQGASSSSPNKSGLIPGFRRARSACRIESATTRRAS